MTNSNENIAPVVKSAFPELYAEHTFHMKKAVSYTYNYCVIDEVIVELWDEMTMAQIAEALTKGLIKNKYNMERADLLRQRKQAATWLKDIDNKLAQCS